MVERRIKAARFPVIKSLDSFDFKVIPSLNKTLVLELARPEPQASNPDGELNRPPNPRLTPWAHRSLPRAPPRRPVEGTPRRTRGPPMD